MSHKNNQTYFIRKFTSSNRKIYIGQSHDVTRARAVLQYDMDGNFIKEYTSCHDAEASTGITKIYKACSGEYKTAGGFIWKFKTDNYPKHVEPYKRPGIPVLQFSKDGKFIKEWSSAKEAAEELYISAPAITACCRKYKNIITVGGYKWKYKKTN